MKIIHQDSDTLWRDFLPLVIELECGSHYDCGNMQHVEWLRNRVDTIYCSGGLALCAYADDGQPMGFMLMTHDRGLLGVRCFGRKATINMLGLFEGFRSRGYGAVLLREAEQLVASAGGECIYVDTYAGNERAIRFYVRHGFIPIAYHPDENGADDVGQVYLYRPLAHGSTCDLKL